VRAIRFHPSGEFSSQKTAIPVSSSVPGGNSFDRTWYAAVAAAAVGDAFGLRPRHAYGSYLSSMALSASATGPVV